MHPNYQISSLQRIESLSARLLPRPALGPIRLDPTKGEIGRPYYRAHSTLDVLALLEDPEHVGSESGSSTLQKWRRGESNTRSRVTTGQQRMKNQALSA